MRSNTDTRAGVRSRKRVVSARQAAFGPLPLRTSVITISLTTGRERNTATTVQRPTHRPSSPAVGLLPALGANGGINHVASPGMVAVSGEGGRIFGVFSLPWPIAWRPSGLQAGQIPTTLTFAPGGPCRACAQGHRTTKVGSGRVTGPAQAGTHPGPLPHDHHLAITVLATRSRT